MPGPGWYLIDEAEAREVLEALREGHLGRYRFRDESATSKTWPWHVRAAHRAIKVILAH